MDISVGIGILVILTRRQKTLARDPPGTELYGTSQSCPSMTELDYAPLLRTEPGRAKEKKCTLRLPTYGGTAVLDHDGSDGTYSYAILRDMW
jgi:hypothetical protein